jgi:DNA-binding transcriptional MocR family regulator
MSELEIDARLARRARGRQPSPIRAIFPLLSVPGMISFGGGYPNPSTFPFANMDLAFHGGEQIGLGSEALARALQYGPSDTDPNLLPHLIAWHHTKDGITLEKESVAVLNGSQEGLFIAAFLFLEKGDAVVVSEPTYPGALAAFTAFTDNFIAIELDDQGMKTDQLESVLRRLREERAALPKFIYTITSGHNPGGVALSPERRRHMLHLAGEYDLLVLEDDPYQLLRLDDTPPPKTLQSLDKEGRVIRLDSFSKIFAPGLRVGYVSGAPEVIRHFVLFKQCSNLHTGSLAQNILAAYLEAATPAGFLAQIKEHCRLYRTHRDAMVAAAREFLPAEVRFNIPGEGFFIWFELPESYDAARLVEQYSRDLKVLMVPGSAFSTQRGCRHCMRASFSMVGPEQIRSGMERFGEMLRRA